MLDWNNFAADNNLKERFETTQDWKLVLQSLSAEALRNDVEANGLSVALLPDGGFDRQAPGLYSLLDTPGIDIVAADRRRLVRAAYDYSSFVRDFRKTPDYGDDYYSLVPTDRTPEPSPSGRKRITVSIKIDPDLREQARLGQNTAFLGRLLETAIAIPAFMKQLAQSSRQKKITVRQALNERLSAGSGPRKTRS